MKKIPGVQKTHSAPGCFLFVVKVNKNCRLHSTCRKVSVMKIKKSSFLKNSQAVYQPKFPYFP